MEFWNSRSGPHPTPPPPPQISGLYPSPPGLQTKVIWCIITANTWKQLRDNSVTIACTTGADVQASVTKAVKTSEYCYIKCYKLLNILLRNQVTDYTMLQYLLCPIVVKSKLDRGKLVYSSVQCYVHSGYLSTFIFRHP